MCPEMVNKTVKVELFVNLRRARQLRGCFETGERAGTRTLDLLIKSQLLYHLSYALFSRTKEAARDRAQKRGKWS